MAIAAPTIYVKATTMDVEQLLSVSGSGDLEYFSEQSLSF